MQRRYNYISEYYKEKFGERTLKICIDGGFTCPNRDGKVGTGGCIFCSERGSGELIRNSDTQGNSIDDVVQNISFQVKQYFNSYRSERANKFIVYFQNYTNTYDSIDNLKRKYDAALIDDRIVGLAIATRPDCINEEVINLISSYTNNYYVSVELGLQTINDDIGNKINRGYNLDTFIKAVELLKKYNIDIVVHIMCGLPFEERKFHGNINIDSIKNGEFIAEDLNQMIDLLNTIGINGVKIHSTYVVQNTQLEKMLQKGEYIPLSFDEYMYELLYIVSHLDKKIVIHRICADAPKNILVEPEWNSHKKWILNGFEKYMKEFDLTQGSLKKV